MAEEENKGAVDDKKIGPVNLEKYHHHPSFGLKIILAVIVVFIIAGGAFAIGRVSSRRKVTFNRSVNNQRFFGQGSSMRRGMGMGGRMESRFSVSGSITKIDNNNLTVKTDTQEVTVVIADTTSIQNSNGIAKKTDLAVGNNISVAGPSDANGQIQAKLIIIK